MPLNYFQMSPGLIALLVLSFVMIAFAVQFALSHKSIRISWLLSACTLLICTALLLISLVRLAEDRSRLFQLLSSSTLKKGKPIQIGAGTYLVEVWLHGSQLIYSYELDNYTEPADPLTSRSQNCDQAKLRAILELGGEIRHEYYRGMQLVDSFSIDRGACF